MSMNLPRYLCSQLIALKTGSRECVVNLEEIWQDGAIIESDICVEAGAQMELRCDTAFFAGSVVHVEAHEFGWRLEVEFSPLTPWTVDRFRPEHLLDVAALGSSGKASGSPAS